jgi:hypothetical protein
VKEDKAKALDMFNKGEGCFKDRDLYVFCANASDGIVTAHPTNKGKQLRDVLGKKGFPLGQEIMQKATEGTIKEVTRAHWRPLRRLGTSRISESRKALEECEHANGCWSVSRDSADSFTCICGAKGLAAKRGSGTSGLQIRLGLGQQIWLLLRGSHL